MKMPENIDAETYVLGCALQSHRAVDQVVAGLKEEMFAHLDNRLIFNAIVYFFSKDMKVDPVSVAAYIEEQSAGKSNLAQLYYMSSLGHSDDVTYYIGLIKDAYKKRECIRTFQMEAKRLAEQNADFEDVAQKVTAKIDALSVDQEHEIRDAEEVLLRNFEGTGMSLIEFVEMQQEKRIRGEDTLRGITTGYPILDATINGFCKGHFIVVGARAGVGKSNFVINLLYNQLLLKRKVVFFSMEMTADEVYLALVARRAGVDMQAAIMGYRKELHNLGLDAEDFQKMVEAIHLIVEDKQSVLVDDASFADTLQFKAKARRYVRSENPDVMFVDYLTLMKGAGKHGTKQEEVQEISQTLRQVAKELKVPLICIAQLNRKSEDENRAPRKSDLRESGQIEQDAHVIMMLARPELQDPHNKPGGLEVHIVKNRFGNQRVIDYYADFAKSTIKECLTVSEEIRKANET